MAPFLLALAAFLAVARVDAFTTRSWDESFSLAAEAVGQMTQDEKIGLLRGVGQFGSRCVGNITPPSRSFNLSSTTLTIPPICLQDGPAGIRLVNNVTGFPTGINTASTFSRRLMRARGAALAEEFKGKGVHVFLGPAMDIMRNPKGGRNWESFGPDPYLTGESAYETIIGVQSEGVQACAKHFLANNQEHWRYGASSNVDERTIYELYGYPFFRSIEADVTSVMCAYNRFNKTSSCHNGPLLDILREQGFRGYTVSDWGATHDSAADNANAGLDMEQPGDWILIGGAVFNGLKSAVNNNSVKPERLDEMVERVLAGLLHLGQEKDYPAINFNAQKPDGSGDLNLNVNVRSDAHTALVREIGAASAVLLKNDRSNATRGLPIDIKKFKTIAVVGQDAKLPKLNCNDLGECNEGTMSVGWGSGTNSLDFLVPPIDAITSWVGSSATITSSLSNDLDAGASAASGKDLCLVFANAMSGELGFYSNVYGNLGDRNDLDLWWKGGSLIERVASVCKNTVAVVHSVGPVALGWTTNANISAVIYAGAPGEQTGPSLVDVLSGTVNPSGRLPFTIAYDEADYGTEIVYNSGNGQPSIDYTEGLFIDYRYMDKQGIKPQFEFGYGLSYTTFNYSSLSIKNSGSSVEVSFTVKNSGSVDGTEIPQLYLGFPAGAGEPPSVLRGFDDIFLKAGESKTVTMTISQRELSTWDVPSHSWVKPSGTFTVSVGASIKDIRLTGTF
ncbi:glycoside hydrolase family 3 protein [Cylindrobasidium torrendii FP15055 ss-10]|uniref:beta-glucosidase n=1 Tax=Cylindrobasidium torrendii FP15055 ss-10 TaxID=1314674 RepID=A0A0D7B857_9AGAR|nr:glycoside hydrolase family 3 protein [Cylindrobasidium torrendii FP15055 ss-10]